MNTETIKGNLILKKDTIIDGDLIVKGNILGKDGERFNLKIKGDIYCKNINCMDVNCRNINCVNIDCWNIDCLDINYFAVCFAYNNIDCKSIKGRRINSKHFVLDGELRINPKKEKN